MSELINWLLKEPSWIEYRTRIDLLNQSENDSEVLLARRKLLEDINIKEMINEASNWPGPELKGHKGIPLIPFISLSFFLI